MKEFDLDPDEVRRLGYQAAELVASHAAKSVLPPGSRTLMLVDDVSSQPSARWWKRSGWKRSRAATCTGVSTACSSCCGWCWCSYYYLHNHYWL